MLASIAVGGCVAQASHHVAHGCAGQCGPPDQLDVMFKRGTTLPAMKRRLDRCASAFVVGMTPPQENGGQYYVQIKTNGIGSGAPGARSFLACLEHGGLASGGWPD
jgi:hypothetical protein